MQLILTNQSRGPYDLVGNVVLSLDDKHYLCIVKKLNQSLYRPGGFQDVEGLRFPIGKNVSTTHRPPFQ